MSNHLISLGGVEGIFPGFRKKVKDLLGGSGFRGKTNRLFALVYTVDGKVGDVILFDDYERAVSERQMISIEANKGDDLDEYCQDDVDSVHDSVILEVGGVMK